MPLRSLIRLKTAIRKTPKVGFVSLGCPKALVDSERILTRLRAEGYEVAASYRAADLVIVNTCGFIDSAVDESLEAIGEALAENGKVIVTGCLGAQPQKILDRHPQVLKITGPQRYEEVVASVHEHLPPQHEPFLDLMPAQGVKLAVAVARRRLRQRTRRAGVLPDSERRAASARLEAGRGL